MTRITALRALEKAVEAGAAMNSDFADAFPVTGPSKPYWMGTSAYNNGSLDAAKALHETMLPGWRWNLWAIGGSTVWRDVNSVYVYDGPDIDPARAWLIAIIRAIIAQEGGEWTKAT